jgi:hypothetical protein
MVWRFRTIRTRCATDASVALISRIQI